MSKYYKLIDGWKAREVFPLPYINDKGKVQHSFFSLYPNTKYVEHIDDKLYMEKLLSATCTITYSEENEEMLKRNGVTYEIDVCPVCGGRREKKLKVNVVEVRDDAEP